MSREALMAECTVKLVDICDIVAVDLDDIVLDEINRRLKIVGNNTV